MKPNDKLYFHHHMAARNTEMEKKQSKFNQSSLIK